MRKAILISATLAMVGSGRAEAVVFSFTPTLLDTFNPPFLTQENLSFSLAVDDAAVRSGSFSYDYRNRYFESGTPPKTTAAFSAIGDVQFLQLFQNSFEGVSFSGGGGPQDSSSAFFSAQLTFDAARQMTGGALSYSTDSYYIFITGMNNIFSGKAGIGSIRASRVVGPLAGSFANSVPEPTTVALLSIAIGMMVHGRWRRRAS